VVRAAARMATDLKYSRDATIRQEEKKTGRPGHGGASPFCTFTFVLTSTDLFVHAFHVSL